ncbi:hypothetical protein N431DRAFT_457104 [Stipitochalara longipes BDJ]|nr:hypothetical protein N431DRAFT_457104 [Stipitochalara longipes BDJ]
MPPSTELRRGRGSPIRFQMPAKLHPDVEVHSDAKTATGSERHDSGSIHQYKHKHKTDKGAGGRATARTEDRASQGSQHHHPLKRDRRTPAAWAAGGCTGWQMENVLDPCQKALRRLFGGGSPGGWGEKGKKAALAQSAFVDLEIYVEAEDAGHKVAGLADDPWRGLAQKKLYFEPATPQPTLTTALHRYRRRSSEQEHTSHGCLPPLPFQEVAL